MTKRVQQLLSNMPGYQEEAPEKPKRGFGHSVISALRKTLAASSVSYLQTLQEESETTDQECPVQQETPIVNDFSSVDIEEAIRRSILDVVEGRHPATRLPCEIELGSMDREWRNGDSALSYDDEGSCSGQMTPKSAASSRFQASSSSGVTYQDLYSFSSEEFRRT